MNTFIIKIADINIKINCRYDYTFDMCKDYIVNDNQYDFSVEVSDEELNNREILYSLESTEFVCIYERIGKELYKYNKVIFHGACIEYKGLAYLFLAKSGTGKTTHIKYWLDNIEGVKVINGDKPIISSDGYVYGTPWCGKERLNTNIKAKLGAIIVLNRDNYNHIEDSFVKDNFSFILSQVFKTENFDVSMSIVDGAFKGLPIYRLYCTNDKEAMEICYKRIINQL